MGTLQGQPCQCDSLFKNTVTHVRVNYPGYSAKKESVANSKLAENQISMAGIADMSACANAINQYLEGYADGHLRVRYTGNVFKKENWKGGKSAWPELTDSIAKDFLNRKVATDSLEGIWESYEGLYTILIIRTSPEEYLGYLISTLNQNWQPGEIKMRFRADAHGQWKLHYFLSSHQEKVQSFRLKDNILEIKDRVVFRKIFPKVPNSASLEAFVSGNFGTSEEFRLWNPETFYIQLQNITAGNKVLIDSLIRKNDVTIRSCRNLILDLRNNNGGDFTCFDGFWPYILKGPATLWGTTYKCTPANLEAYQLQLRKLDGEISPDFLVLLGDLQQSANGEYRIPNDTIAPDSITKLPERVILLVNQECRSSTENFILTARQSSKVVVAGARTGGVADFEEVVDFRFGCQEFVLEMPIGTSNRLPGLPINQIGIEPDIYLKTNGRAWQKWVAEVLRKLPR